MTVSTLDDRQARLLIVDDEAAQMKALCDTLRDRGYDVMGFVSPSEALAVLERERFDLVLTDLMMPETDGISLLRQAIQIDPDLVGVVMTGHGTIDTAVEAMKVGALDYILKPFKLSAVLPVLARALAVRRLRIENADLTRRLAERTAELEIANQGLEAFTHSIAHDLRAPLRFVRGFADILLDDGADPTPAPKRDLLVRIAGSAGHMERLIDDLLRLAHIGRYPISKGTVAMAALARTVSDELRETNAGRPIEVVIHELPDAVGDEALVRQIFVNLLSNAFKFTRGRDPACIEVAFEERDGEWAYVVRDNGAGFDMEFEDQLFGVFRRLHRADQFEGTGVGLSIVRSIVQRHGGKIWADAAVGRGAAFFFTLPLAR